jgi:hypothetical protein
MRPRTPPGSDSIAMECATLYGTPAWWRMKRQDEQTDPSKPARTGDRGGPAADDDVAPRAPFAPPVSNPSVLRLLNGLNPSVTPLPMEVASTDGELAASFSAGPRPAPVAEETPAAEASVVVRPTRGSSTKSPKAPPARDRVDTTFRLRPQRRALALPIAVGILFLGVVIAAWLGHSNRAPSVAASPPSARVSLAVSPVPSVPAPTAAPEPVPTVAEPVVAAPVPHPAVAPVRANASPRAAPSVTKPGPRDPSRSKDHEPERAP